MSKLPQVVRDAQEEADISADAHYDAWKKLQNVENPSYDDLQEWIAAKSKFDVSQAKFEELLREFLAS